MRYLRFAVTELDCDSQVRQGLFHAGGALRDSDRLSAVAAASAGSRMVREHLAHARELAWLLREHGVVVHELWTRRQGYVVYQDRWQLVAEPFRDTGA